jgi:hypothetical protein
MLAGIAIHTKRLMAGLLAIFLDQFLPLESIFN